MKAWRLLAFFAAWWLQLAFTASEAYAGSFDDSGSYIPDPQAVAFQGFGPAFDVESDRFVPEDAELPCLAPAFEQQQSDDALEGEHHVHVNANLNEGCAERFLLPVPALKASYRATVWMRHGAVAAQMTITYPDDGGETVVFARMGPTGRVTSDGWVELASNDFPVDGERAEAVYLRVIDYDGVGSQIDALELVPSGDYWESVSCTGVGDPICGDEAICRYNRCRLGRLYVPPLPETTMRNEIVDVMVGQLQLFFGGRKTRLNDLPIALSVLEQTRSADKPWRFWNGWAKAIRRLHDWHTRASGSITSTSRKGRLNVCFYEGDADSSELQWPKHPSYRDLLVSHVGNNGTHGIKRGDRLVAVDGRHPIAWALDLIELDWGFWQADDDDVYSELAERMRGLILAYATNFSVIHCDASSKECELTPKTYVVGDFEADERGQVNCDNRPFYHFKDDNPPGNHGIGWNFYRGPIKNTTEEEAIYGMLWDTLYGGGDPNGHVNSNISAAIEQFKAEARGVILDHRAGSGGTMDAAEHLTHLVRPVEILLVFHSPMEVAGFDGPTTKEEGVALFNQFRLQSPMKVGSSNHDPDLPVALLLHRDGSASDLMPLGMKGAPKVRIFGPHATAGAFSTYYNYQYWAGLSYQLASGDTISSQGEARIGHGVQPDVVVLPKQSDLLDGKDSIHEAALAWVRQELKP